MSARRAAATNYAAPNRAQLGRRFRFRLSFPLHRASFHKTVIAGN